MASGIIKKIIQNTPKVIKKSVKPKRIIKSKRKKLFPLEIKPGPGIKKRRKNWHKLDSNSPYIHVDELGSRPLHRGTGPSGVEKKKLKDAGERLSKWYKKKDKADEIRSKRMGGTKYGYNSGGLVKGFPKLARKGWK